MSCKDGTNSIISNSAASIAFDPNMTELDPAWAKSVQEAKVVLLQREIPEFVNVVAARTAKQSGAFVILDVGGRDEPLTEQLILNVDIISPNETELERMIGKKAPTLEDARLESFKFIQKYPHIKVLLKQGKFGCSLYWIENGEEKEISKPAFRFEDFLGLKLVDTVAAGDCFTGGFAVKIL